MKSNYPSSDRTGHSSWLRVVSNAHLSLFKNFVRAESCDWLSPGLLGAAQQVWADMFHGECFPAVQQGRRSKETHISPTSRKDLQGGAAVFNVECAHAAEPFTNERCSVIGFTYVVGARTHTRKDSQSSPSCWWKGYKQRTQVPRCLGGIFRSHRAAAGCRPVP